MRKLQPWRAAFAAFSIALSTALPLAATAAGPTSINISNYSLVGRYDLPEPTRTTAPTNSLLAQEASAVTYNWDTNTLFVLGDGSTSIVQVSLTGQLIDSMTLAQNPANPQGTQFYDLEGLAYVGNGQFVFAEERYRQLNLFTYAAGTTLGASGVQTVKLGTTVGNIGIEGVSWDPLTGGFIVVKEKDPIGIFQTTVNWAAGSASNGSAGTVNPVNLFNPALLGVIDIADVFALSNLPSLQGSPFESHLLVLSEESGRLVQVDRSGNIVATLNLGVPFQHEGVAMDRNGVLYIVNELGGGDIDHPQLWVYAPVPEPSQALLLVAGLLALATLRARRRG
jgi:uncharacterized protein YjiK